MIQDVTCVLSHSIMSDSLNLMDYSLPHSSNHGIFQVRTLEWVILIQFSSVQSLSHVWLFANPWTAARQASLSITNSWSSLKLMSLESVMPSNHLILCHPLLLLPSIFPSIRVFSNEAALHIRWPKYWSFGFNISPSNINIQNKNPKPWSLTSGNLDYKRHISYELN